MASEDDRRTHWLRDLLIPLVIAIIVGISSATITVKVALAVIETEMVGIKEDVVDLKAIMTLVQENSISKTKNELLTADNQAEILEIWREINRIKAVRYTREDSMRDIQMLRLEMKALHNIPPTFSLNRDNEE